MKISFNIFIRVVSSIKLKVLASILMYQMNEYEQVRTGSLVVKSICIVKYVKVSQSQMIGYKVEDLNIQPLNNIFLHKLKLKINKIESFDEKYSKQLKIYSSDQLHLIVSKIAVLMQIPMHYLACVFKQKDNLQTPYSYQLNRVSFDQQSVLNITSEYKKQENIKEIGPIPFFINELEYLDRFRDDESSLVPKVTIRPYTIGELFDLDQSIDIFILPYSDVEQELKNQQLIIKSPQYIIYFKYLFLYKYFPCSQEGSLMIDTQYQLKFNEVQDYIFNPQSSNIFEGIQFSQLTESIQINYQLNQLEVDLVLIFDSIKMKEFQNLIYVQYLYIREGVQFYTQKAHSDQLYSYNQFYEDILVFSLKSGLKCKINVSGQITGDYRIPIQQYSEIKDPGVDIIMIQLKQVQTLFNDFLNMLKSVTQQFSDSIQSQELKANGSKNQQQLISHQSQVEYNMISKIQVQGLFISDDLLKQIVQQNKEIFKLKGINERQIGTQIFVNKEASIDLIETTESIALFEIQSSCSPLVKLLIPTIVLYILINKGMKSNETTEKQSRGNARLMTTDPYLYKQLKDGEQYGRLCKKNQQPIPIEKEQEGDVRVYKYHNFTSNKPQLYQCPINAPYMGFITQKHQKDFCLPCCYPVRQDRSQKKSEVTKTCFADHKYSKDSSKRSDVNTYIFTNPQKLQLNRNTILHPDIQKFISQDMNDQMAWFVYSLRIPEYTVNQTDRIDSLIESCCYLLSVKKQDFIERMSKQMNLTPFSRSQYLYLVNKNDQLLSMSHFEFIITQIVENLFNCNLIIIGDMQERSSNDIAQVQCFGVNRDKSILVQRRKHIYNPVILGQCESNRKIFNTDHISSKFLLIPGEYISKLKQQFESLRDQRPHSLARIVQKLKQSSDIHNLQLQTQIVNQQGFVHFIELVFKFKQRSIAQYLLPVQSSLPITQDQIKIDIKFKQVQGYNEDTKALEYIIENIYKCTPNSRIIDTNGQMRGILFNNLFFYSEDHQLSPNIPIHQQIQFNPLLLNQSIIENKFETMSYQTVNASLRFIYFSNIYRLMRMQYTYFLNNENKALNDWSQIFTFCSMEELLQRIEKLSKQKRQYGIQELVKLKSCLNVDEQQFFCERNKLLLPNEFKPYIELLKKDVNIDASIRAKQLYQIMLQEFVFQDREGDHLQQGQIQ